MISLVISLYRRLAQLARALGLGPRGSESNRRFKSSISDMNTVEVLDRSGGVPGQAAWETEYWETWRNQGFEELYQQHLQPNISNALGADESPKLISSGSIPELGATEVIFRG